MNLEMDKNIFDSETVNIAVIDNGCPEAVMGTTWFRVYKDTLPKGHILKSSKCDEMFKFGPSKTYESKERIEIPVSLGKMQTTMKVCLVDCDIPLLVSSQILENWESSQSYKDCTLTIGKTGETFKLMKLAGGHFGLRLQMDPTDPKLERCSF